MPPPDDPLYPLAKTAPRTGRSVRARDYTLPKPYRKKAFVDDTARTRMSPLRLAMLVAAGLVVAGLIGVLIMLVQENRDAPHVLVIAAPPAKPAPTPSRHSPAPPQDPLADPSLPSLPSPPVAPQVRPVRARAGHASANLTAVPADPDVALIAAILALTMPSSSAEQQAEDCPEEDPAEHACLATRGIKP
ncbi:MAG: hypothetical protein ACJ8GW_01205 [Massilia sp.]